MKSAIHQAPIELSLLSGITEHLQASLRGISDHSHRLQVQANDEDCAPVCLDDIEAISSGCSEAMAAVNQLVDLLQLQRDALPFVDEEVRVQDMLDRAYLGSCELAKHQGAALRMCNLAPDSVVRVDPQRVQQILTSLLNSVLTRSPDDALVQFTAMMNQDGALEISVAPAEPLLNEKEDTSLSDRQWAGQGAPNLDLAIAGRVANLMNCDLKVEANIAREPVHILTFARERTIAEGSERSVA